MKLKLKLIKLIKEIKLFFKPEILLALVIAILIALPFALSDQSAASDNEEDTALSTVVLVQLLQS